MKIEKSGEHALKILSIEGRLDSNTAQNLEATLGQSEVRDAASLVLDLSKLDYVSSAGLRVLLKAAKYARANKKGLALAGLVPHVREVFDISGFTALFGIYATPAEAQASLE